jgi:hypothetical protein
MGFRLFGLGYNRSRANPFVTAFTYGSMLSIMGHQWVVVTENSSRFIRCIVCGRGPNYWVSAMGRLIPPALPDC